MTVSDGSAGQVGASEAYTEQSDVPASTRALTDAAALNHLAFSSMAPAWVRDQIQGQDGMTADEREQYAEEEKARAARLQAAVEAEWQVNLDSL